MITDFLDAPYSDGIRIVSYSLGTTPTSADADEINVSTASDRSSHAYVDDQTSSHTTGTSPTSSARGEGKSSRLTYDWCPETRAMRRSVPTLPCRVPDMENGKAE